MRKPLLVANWKMNELVCETDRFTIRIDEMADSSLRYVSWSKSKTFKDKPDLVINNGSYQFQGTRGGMIYTFINNDWTYELDRVTMAESDDQYGLFLTIYQNGQQKSKYKCRETK